MSVNRYDPEDWGGLHMVPKPDGDWVCYEAWEHVSQQLAALKEENERLKDRAAELEKSSISRTLLVDRLQEIPDEREMNLHDAEIIWSILEEINDGNFDFKEPANEG